jgi:hypothetical protein
LLPLPGMLCHARPGWRLVWLTLDTLSGLFAASWLPPATRTLAQRRAALGWCRT